MQALRGGSSRLFDGTKLNNSRTILDQGGATGGYATTIAHLFRRATGEIYCLTVDRSGANIPSHGELGPWVYVKDVELCADDQRPAVDSNGAISDLDKYGYHLVGAWYAGQ